MAANQYRFKSTADGSRVKINGSRALVATSTLDIFDFLMEVLPREFLLASLVRIG